MVAWSPNNPEASGSTPAPLAPRGEENDENKKTFQTEKETPNQGSLTEREGSVVSTVHLLVLTSLDRTLFKIENIIYIFIQIKLP